MALSFAAGSVDPAQHDLEEYRLAAKKYHRKIRASNKEEVVIGLAPSDDVENNTTAGGNSSSSILLDLPYPSHFLYSLQLLNLSLPFLEESAVVLPEDPPTPQFELSQVINNGQFIRQQQQQPEASASVSEVITAGQSTFLFAHQVGRDGHANRFIVQAVRIALSSTVAAAEEKSSNE